MNTQLNYLLARQRSAELALAGQQACLRPITTLETAPAIGSKR